ncbi:unnamed protein product [Sphagnum compactum]
MHKLATPMCDNELGREILKQLGALQLNGMVPPNGVERSLVKASTSMQKPALMEVHMRFMKQFSELERDWQLMKDPMAAKPETRPAKKKAVSLEGMRSIRLLELKVGKRYHGRVLHVTLCAEAFFLNLIQTMVEDEDGYAARVMIEDSLAGLTSWAKVQGRYPNGAKISIKAPLLSELPDDSVALYVNTEDDLIVQSDFPAVSVEVNVWAKLDAAALRAEGNRLFARQDWTGSIELYTKCIQKCQDSVRRKPTLNKHKKKGASENGTTSNGKVVDETVMLAFSNRAAAWMKSCHYERALKDAHEALKLEPHHLKSIYRKGCALHGMQQYELACKCFELALEQSPEKDIKLALQKSKTCDMQSRLGVYELSKYLVGGFEGPLPEFSDYVGPVEIRSSEARCRRGLFVTKDVEVGELLLVSNALAVVHNGSHATGKNTSPSGRSNAFLRDELLCSLSNLLLKSPKWLEQACSLADCECHGNTKVPPLELFRPNSKWTAGKEDVVLPRLKGVLLQNALDESGSCTRVLQAGRGSQFLGLWPLPSFINHSCTANAVRLHVGDALFLHASRHLEAGEEVTLAYVNTLLPKQMRHELLEKDNWEFTCSCSRCDLESNLSAPLKQVTKRFQSLWGWKEAVTPGQVECFKMAKLALRLEHLLKQKGLYLYERQLVRASFFVAYWVGYLNIDRLGTLCVKLPLPDMLIDAVTAVAPSDTMTSFFAGYWLKRLEEQGASRPVIHDAQQRAIHIYRCVYGNQTSGLLKELLEAHEANTIL